MCNTLFGALGVIAGSQATMDQDEVYAGDVSVVQTLSGGGYGAPGT